MLLFFLPQRIYFRDPISRKNIPTTPDGVCVCASRFFLLLFFVVECVNDFWLAGQTRRPPGDVCDTHRGIVRLYLLMFEYIYVFVFFSTKQAKKKGRVILPQLNQELHTGEGCCSAALSDHVNEVPWPCSH